MTLSVSPLLNSYNLWHVTRNPFHEVVSLIAVIVLADWYYNIKNILFPKTVSQWNALSEHIACAPSLLTFKTAISHENCSLPSF